jgi:catechol 2,3-dioxygenase
LPDETRVGVVRLLVSDLDRSVRFYQDVLGFALLNRGADNAQLGAGSAQLLALHSGAARPLTEKRLGLYHFAVLLPDRASLGACLAHLLEVGLRPGAADHLVSEAIYIRDPDGLGIEIYRDRPRAEWATQGQELAMASEALDFADVTQAAGGQVWKGMPAGTVVGHMHLQVGDLNQAKAFYHAGLGLDLIVWSYPGALFLSAGGYHHHLGINTWAGPVARPASELEPKLLEWELLLPAATSVSAAGDSLAQHGYVVTAERFGDIVAADPWGTQLRLTTLI